MTDYAITFARKYLHEEHPTHATGIDPNGYVGVSADDIGAAEAIAEGTFGPYWDGVEPVTDELEARFPEGKLFTAR